MLLLRLLLRCSCLILLAKAFTVRRTRQRNERLLLTSGRLPSWPSTTTTTTTTTFRKKDLLYHAAALHGLTTSSESDSDSEDELLFLLREMTDFFCFMVDDQKNRFYYECHCRQGAGVGGGGGGGAIEPIRRHQVHPIRDLAAAWDATKVLEFWKEKATFSSSTTTTTTTTPNLTTLEKAIITTLKSYPTCPIPPSPSFGTTGNGLMIGGLPEPSNISHSALAILAFVGALKLSLPIVIENDRVISDSDENTSIIISNDVVDVVVVVDGLTRGILSMQQNDGSFRTQFLDQQGSSSSVYQGIDFYPGEAMLALLEVYKLSVERMPGILDSSTRDAILPSLQRALDFYSNYYWTNQPDTNYNIWQIQAFSRFYDVAISAATTTTTTTNDMNRMQLPNGLLTTYIQDMCQGIVTSKSWKYELARGRSFYPNLQTVEIACGLDALVDGIHVLMRAMETGGGGGSSAANDNEESSSSSSMSNNNIELLVRQAQNAVTFLQWSLDQAPQGEAKGGLGYGGVHVMEQRLDVTGHAISAITKWNRIRQTL